jgi:hydrogenase maturation protease
LEVTVVSGSVRIVGCGRWSMGDDQAGLVTAERLAGLRLPQTTVALDESPGSGLAELMEGGEELLIVIDAARADARHPEGSFTRIDNGAFPRGLRRRGLCGTHTLSVDAGLELARALGVLPADVWIYVIFGRTFDRSLRMRDAVAAAVPRLVERVEDDVRVFLGVRSCTS